MMMSNAPPPMGLGLVRLAWSRSRSATRRASPGAAASTARTWTAARGDGHVLAAATGDTPKSVLALVALLLGERSVALKTPVLVFEPVGLGGPPQHRVLEVFVAGDVEQRPVVVAVVERGLPRMAGHAAKMLSCSASEGAVAMSDSHRDVRPIHKSVHRIASGQDELKMRTPARAKGPACRGNF